MQLPNDYGKQLIDAEEIDIFCFIFGVFAAVGVGQLPRQRALSSHHPSTSHDRLASIKPTENPITDVPPSYHIT